MTSSVSKPYSSFSFWCEVIVFVVVLSFMCNIHGYTCSCWLVFQSIRCFFSYVFFILCSSFTILCLCGRPSSAPLAPLSVRDLSSLFLLYLRVVSHHCLLTSIYTFCNILAWNKIYFLFLLLAFVYLYISLTTPEHNQNSIWSCWWLLVCNYLISVFVKGIAWEIILHIPPTLYVS